MTTTTTTPQEETILEKIEDWAKLKWQAAKEFLDDDVWPIVVDFAHLIVSQVESAEASNAVSLIADLVTGNFSGAAIAAGDTALSTVSEDAKNDALKALQDAQTAQTQASAAVDTATAAVTNATTAPAPDDNAPDGESAS